MQASANTLWRSILLAIIQYLRPNNLYTAETYSSRLGRLRVPRSSGQWALYLVKAQSVGQHEPSHYILTWQKGQANVFQPPQQKSQLHSWEQHHADIFTSQPLNAFLLNQILSYGFQGSTNEPSTTYSRPFPCHILMHQGQCLKNFSKQQCNQSHWEFLQAGKGRGHPGGTNMKLMTVCLSMILEPRILELGFTSLMYGKQSINVRIAKVWSVYFPTHKARSTDNYRSIYRLLKGLGAFYEERILQNEAGCEQLQLMGKTLISPHCS